MQTTPDEVLRSDEPEGGETLSSARRARSSSNASRLACISPRRAEDSLALPVLAGAGIQRTNVASENVNSEPALSFDQCHGNKLRNIFHEMCLHVFPHLGRHIH